MLNFLSIGRAIYGRLLFILLLISMGSYEATAEKSLYDYSARCIDGHEIPFTRYKGKVVLIVNTAAHCGFTDQLTELQKLQDRYSDRGLIVLGFPSTDFSELEQESNPQLKKFCKKRYGVSFQLFSKGRVTGSDKLEVYKYLTEEAPKDLRGEVTFTFEKFLIDRNGVLRGRFGSFTNPLSIRVTEMVEALLKEGE
ncbi:MAG: glutathione peroxidase [Bdellovibrionales bacterium]|nr:glutathione peroxidase [Bdellovibrionales bacterium]